jgi:hypothetical protein
VARSVEAMVTARREPPAPNCGHLGGPTLTFVPRVGLWLCALCFSAAVRVAREAGAQALTLE